MKLISIVALTLASLAIAAPTEKRDVYLLILQCNHRTNDAYRTVPASSTARKTAIAVAE